MATPEIQKNAPAGAPVSKPSDALLKSFRLTIQQRWQEFDTATMNEARKDPKARFWSLLGMASEADIRAWRDKDAKFLQAKATFDKAIIAINSISTDEDLKKILATPGNLASSINDLKEYLAKADARIEYNAVLSHTFADLTDLKAKVTESPADKIEAASAKASIPELAVATTAAWSLLPSKEVRWAIDGIKGEITEKIEKAIGPWGMIFKWLKDVPVKDVATQIRELSKDWNEKKWLDDPFDKLFAGIKLFFLKFQISRAWLDLSKDLTPEELKLAGMEVPVAPKKVDGPKVPTEWNIDGTTNPELMKQNADNLKYGVSVDMLLKFGQSREERAENVLWNAGRILKEPKFNNLNIWALRKGYNVNTKKIELWLLWDTEKSVISSIPIDPIEKQKALNLIARLFFDASGAIQSEVSACLLKGWQDISIYTGVLNASKDLRKFTPFWSIDLSNPQAMIQEWAGRFIPSLDPTTRELTGELAEDFNSSMWKKNALWIFVFAKDYPVPLDAKSIDNHFKSDNLNLSKDPKDQEKLRKILQFWVNLRGVIKNDPTIHLGYWDKVAKSLEKVFTLSDLGILYTFLNGKPNLESMTSVEKWFLIMKIADMIQISDKDLFWGYSTEIVNALLWETTTIDPKVQKVFMNMLWFATDKAWNLVSDTAEVIWWSAKANPIVAIWIFGSIFFGPWFSKRTAVFGPLRK